jgi:hypothetical protein
MSPLVSLAGFEIFSSGKEKGPLGPFNVVHRRSVRIYRAGGEPITRTRPLRLPDMAFSPSNAMEKVNTVSNPQRQRGPGGKI